MLIILFYLIINLDNIKYFNILLLNSIIIDMIIYNSY